MAGPADVDHVQIECADRAIEMRVDEVEARCRAPIPQQSWLDMPGAQRLAQQRIVEKVDLSDR